MPAPGNRHAQSRAPARSRGTRQSAAPCGPSNGGAATRTRPDQVCGPISRHHRFDSRRARPARGPYHARPPQAIGQRRTGPPAGRQADRRATHHIRERGARPGDSHAASPHFVFHRCCCIIHRSTSTAVARGVREAGPQALSESIRPDSGAKRRLRVDICRFLARFWIPECANLSANEPPFGGGPEGGADGWTEGDARDGLDEIGWSYRSIPQSRRTHHFGTGCRLA